MANKVFWLCVIGGAIWGFAVTAIEEYKKDMEKKAKDEAEWQRLRREEEAKVAAHKAAQQNFRTELVKVTETSLNTFEALPNHLLEAESRLDEAELDFKEGAFAPFWDSIELATMCLGRFDSSITSINNSLKRYGELSTLYKGSPPRFPIVIDSINGMVAGGTINDRMKEIVRQAQRNFQFASIYEQRKTNQILVTGFTNLAQALDGMGRRISKSIDVLSTQVSEMSASLNESMSFLGEQMATVSQSTASAAESLQEMHSTLQREADQQRERHDRALEMLNNIQRHRMPSGFYSGIGTEPAP